MAQHPDFGQDVEALLENQLFSQAFYQLCSGLEDLDGLIAYGLHKDDKRKALIDRPRRRNDVSFHDIHNRLTAARCDILRDNAQQRLKTYVDNVIKRVTPGIQRDYIKTHIAKRDRWQFWKGVGASMVASLAMMGLLYAAPWFAQQNPAHLAEMIDERLDKIEAVVARQSVPFPPLDEIEPAAGAGPHLGEGHLLDDACLTDSDTLNDPACRGDY